MKFPLGPSPELVSAIVELKLLLYKEYYNRDRVHRGLDGAPPNAQSGKTDRKVARINDYRWKEHCHGLYQLPEAA